MTLPKQNTAECNSLTISTMHANVTDFFHNFTCSICKFHAWERRGLHTVFWSENMTGRDHLEDLGVDGKIISEWIRMKGRDHREDLGVDGKIILEWIRMKGRDHSEDQGVDGKKILEWIRMKGRDHSEDLGEDGSGEFLD